MYFIYNNISFSKKPLKKFVTLENDHLCSDEVLNLIECCLKYDPAERITAAEAMKHPYFNNVHKY